MSLPFRLEDLQRRELPSGATVMALPYRRLPLLLVAFMLKVGSERDPRGREGLSDLTAEALTLGTRRRPMEELYRAVEGLGATLSASSGWDRSMLRVTGLADDWEGLLSLAREVYLEPGFPPEEISRAVQRRVASLTKSRDEAERVADELIWSEVMAHTPYDHPPYGTLASVRGLQTEDVLQLYRSEYSPRGTVLLLIGDRDPEELLDRGCEALQGWRAPEHEGAPKGPSIEGRKILLVDRPDLTQNQIRIAFLGLERRDPRYLPYRLMNYILGGGGFSSRLMERVRSQKGLTYGIRSSLHALRVRGPMVISTFTPADTTLQAFEEVFATVEGFLREGPTPRELEEAKGYFCGSFPLRLETPSQWAREILELELYGLGLEELVEFPRRVQAVSPEGVLEVAREVLRLDAFRAVVLGRVRDMEGGFRRWGEVEVKSFADVASR